MPAPGLLLVVKGHKFTPLEDSGTCTLHWIYPPPRMPVTTRMTFVGSENPKPSFVTGGGKKQGSNNLILWNTVLYCLKASISFSYENTSLSDDWSQKGPQKQATTWHPKPNIPKFWKGGWFKNVVVFFLIGDFTVSKDSRIKQQWKFTMFKEGVSQTQLPPEN